MLPAELVNELGGIFERCQSRYPTIRLSGEPFYSHIEGILIAGHPDHVAETPNPAGRACPDCLRLLRELHHQDLFLALACALGDRIAWEFFADEYMPLLRRFAGQACRDPDAAQDLAQEMVTSLLGEGQAGPETNPVPKGKLDSYNGRGALSSWLRAAVAHAAIDRFRRGRKQVSLDEMIERGDPPPSPEPARETCGEERLDAQWGPELARCLKNEIAKLDARDRLLLGLYHVHGVPLKAIGSRFGVLEATASRWLDRVRGEVRKRVERELRKKHGLSAHELKSLWHWIAEAGDAALDTVLQPLSQTVPAQKKMQGGPAESSSIGVIHE